MAEEDDFKIIKGKPKVFISCNGCKTNKKYDPSCYCAPNQTRPNKSGTNVFLNHISEYLHKICKEGSNQLVKTTRSVNYLEREDKFIYSKALRNVKLKCAPECCGINSVKSNSSSEEQLNESKVKTIGNQIPQKHDKKCLHVNINFVNQVYLSGSDGCKCQKGLKTSKECRCNWKLQESKVETKFPDGPESYGSQYCVVISPEGETTIFYKQGGESSAKKKKHDRERLIKSESEGSGDEDIELSDEDTEKLSVKGDAVKDHEEMIKEEKVTSESLEIDDKDETRKESIRKSKTDKELEDSGFHEEAEVTTEEIKEHDKEDELDQKEEETDKKDDTDKKEEETDKKDDTDKKEDETDKREGESDKKESESDKKDDQSDKKVEDVEKIGDETLDSERKSDEKDDSNLESEMNIEYKEVTERKTVEDELQDEEDRKISSVKTEEELIEEQGEKAVEDKLDSLVEKTSQTISGSSKDSKKLSEEKASAIYSLSMQSIEEAKKNWTKDTEYLEKEVGRYLIMSCAEIGFVKPLGPINYLGGRLYKFREMMSTKIINDGEKEDALYHKEMFGITEQKIRTFNVLKKHRYRMEVKTQEIEEAQKEDDIKEIIKGEDPETENENNTNEITEDQDGIAPEHETEDVPQNNTEQ